MNVQPGIHSHPKYVRLRQQVGSGAMHYLTKLWAFCQQNQRGQRLGKISPGYVEAICEWDGTEGTLFKALTEKLSPTRFGFVEIGKSGGITVHDWDENNAQLIQIWNLNAKRWPKGKRKVSARIPHEAPTEAAQTTTGDRADLRLERTGTDPKGVDGTGNQKGPVRKKVAYPETVEEVIAHGAKMNPIVPEDRCRAFFAHFEGQAKEGPNGKFWVASSSNGGEMVVTNWQARLAGWRVDPDNKKTAPNPGAVNSRIIFLQRELKETAEAGDDATLQLRREMRQQLEVLLKKQKELTE